MHADHFFRIGHGHAVCQDYAASGMEPYPYAIVADGCSSSKNSEIGAAILCKIAVSCLRSLFINRDIFEAVVCERIMAVQKIMSLENETFDATLCIVYFDPASKIVFVSIWGDGMVLSLSKNGFCDYNIITYTQNAPFYLSYYLDEKRIKQYRTAFAYQRKEVLSTVMYEKTRVTDFKVDEKAYSKPFNLTFPSENYNTVLVFSDGLGSFQSKNRQYQVEDILNVMLPFKSTAGAFVQRRMNKLMKELAQNEIFPLDDVSVAGIWLGDEP